MSGPALLVTLALAVASGCRQQASEPQQQEASADQVGPVKGVDRRSKGKPAPDVGFTDPEGEEVTLAQFRGAPLLVNLWATWCAPCVKELPTLDELARGKGGQGALRVIAVSQDTGPQPSVDAFLDKLKVPELGAYHDPKMALSGALGAEVLPTTVLYDAQGREVWRYTGDLDWSGAEAARLLAESGAPPTG